MSSMVKYYGGTRAGCAANFILAAAWCEKWSGWASRTRRLWCKESNTLQGITCGDRKLKLRTTQMDQQVFPPPTVFISALGRRHLTVCAFFFAESAGGLPRGSQALLAWRQG
eukprot:5593661-Amphidinium_carterae.1